MASVTEVEVGVYAFCPDSQCIGYAQETVQAVKTTTETLYVDNGGTIPGTDCSHTYLRFADPDDVGCRYCDRARQLTEAERPDYPTFTDPDRDSGAATGRVDQLTALLVEQQGQLAELRARLEGSATIGAEESGAAGAGERASGETESPSDSPAPKKRGPGRPRKTETEAD